MNIFNVKSLKVVVISLLVVISIFVGQKFTSLEAQAADTEKLAGIVITKDQDLLSIDTSMYLKLKNVNHSFLIGTTRDYVYTNNNNYFKISNFLKAKQASKGNASLAFETLKDKGSQENILPLKVVSENGKPTIEAPTEEAPTEPNETEEDFEVESID